MGKIYNIMDRLTNDKPVIKIDETHEYIVMNSKNKAILINEIAKDEKLDDFERMDKIIEAALGKEATDYINSLDISVKAHGTIVTAVMAALGEQDLEDVEKEAEKQKKNFRK